LVLWFALGPDGGPKAIGSALTCRVGYQQVALYRHVFVAKEKGFFEKHGLDVELIQFADANQQLQALLAGQIDAAGLSNMNVVLTVEHKEPGTLRLGPFLVWKEDAFPDYIISRKEAGIKSLKELEGRTIGLHPGSAVKAFCLAVLSPVIDTNKCTFIEITPGTMYAALASGRVDALYCMDPVPTVAVEKGVAEVLLPNPMARLVPPPTPISALTFTSKGTRDGPDKARRIIAGVEDAIEYMRKPGTEKDVAEIVAKYTGASAELSLKMNRSEYWKTSEIDRKRVQELADKFAECGAAPARVDTKDLVLTPQDLGVK